MRVIIILFFLIFSALNAFSQQESNGLDFSAFIHKDVMVIEIINKNDYIIDLKFDFFNMSFFNTFNNPIEVYNKYRYSSHLVFDTTEMGFDGIYFSKCKNDSSAYLVNFKRTINSFSLNSGEKFVIQITLKKKKRLFSKIRRISTLFSLNNNHYQQKFIKVQKIKTPYILPTNPTK